MKMKLWQEHQKAREVAEARLKKVEKELERANEQIRVQSIRLRDEIARNERTMLKLLRIKGKINEALEL